LFILNLAVLEVKFGKSFKRNRFSEHGFIQHAIMVFASNVTTSTLIKQLLSLDRGVQ